MTKPEVDGLLDYREFRLEVESLNSQIDAQQNERPQYDCKYCRKNVTERIEMRQVTMLARHQHANCKIDHG
jgi:hypothetical protein